MSSGARKALNRKTSAAAGDSSCTASKLAAQVVTTDFAYTSQGRKACFEELQATGAIAFEIASKGRSRLDDVGRRLLQGEREPVQLAGELFGGVAFLGLGILPAATTEEECGRVLDG